MKCQVDTLRVEWLAQFVSVLPTGNDIKSHRDVISIPHDVKFWRNEIQMFYSKVVEPGFEGQYVKSYLRGIVDILVLHCERQNMRHACVFGPGTRSSDFGG